MLWLEYHCSGKKDLRVEGDEKQESDSEMGSTMTYQERVGGPRQAICGKESHQILNDG